MSNHTRAIVPLAAGAGHSPELQLAGHDIDFGLFAESLIYYEQPILAISGPGTFASLVRRFQEEDAVPVLSRLLRDEQTKLLYYTSSTGVLSEGDAIRGFAFFNLAHRPMSFYGHVLNHQAIAAAVAQRRHLDQLRRAALNRVVEFKHEQYAHALRHAEAEIFHAGRFQEAVNLFIGELFESLHIPPVEVTVAVEAAGAGNKVKWDFDRHLAQHQVLKKLELTPPLVLGIFGDAYQTLWAAAMNSCDLYLASPMSALHSSP
jgi:hypothetical protein